MNFKPAQCPSCAGALQVPDDRPTVKCMYCGGTVVVRDAIRAAAAATVPNLLKLARAAAQSSNHQEAYDYNTRVLELDGDNAEAWAGKAEACGRLSGSSSFRLPEMVEYYRNAIEATDRENMVPRLDEAATNISSLTMQFYRNARDGLSPAFGENATWTLYLSTLGDVFKVLDQALKVIPHNVLILQTIVEICRDNSRRLSYINRRTNTRNWRDVSAEWSQAIERKLTACVHELQLLDPSFATASPETSKGLLDSINDSKRVLLFVAAALLLFVVIGLLVSSNNTGSEQSQRSIVGSSSPSPELRCAGYQQLTYKSNYDDVIKVLGPPDSESSKGPPEAVIPNIFMHYRRCGYTVISIYGKSPKNGIFNKATTRYIGTKGETPAKTLHVSQEKFRALVDALPMTP